MKKLMILTACILFTGICVKAQSSDPESDYVKKTYSKDKKTIVDEYMSLNVQDGGKFWPLYAEYEAKREKIAAARIDVINKYVNGYNTMTPEIADKLVKSSFTNTLALDKLDSVTYEKVKIAIGAINSAKFMQLEIYLQTMWKAVVQSNIPLIGAINSTKQN
jgi:hypothetical protein